MRGARRTIVGAVAVAILATAASAAAPGPPSGVVVTGSTTARFSATVDANGFPTTVRFQYGLDPRYSGGGPLVYTQSTPLQNVGAFERHKVVTASVTGLVPNAVYHVRLVATNIGGTAYGQDLTFMTRRDPKPPPPVLGQRAWVLPVSGLIMIKPPPGESLKPAADRALVKGAAFVPLTEQRQIPLGTQIDASHGVVLLSTATTRPGKSQLGTFGGAIFSVTQPATGLLKGQTTLSLLEGDFPGAPSYADCPSAAADGSVAALSSKVLQALHARESHGSFKTRGRFSAGTVRGTEWTTVDRCDGTLTTVQRGTVVVDDFRARKTVTLHAGQSYLAPA
jgi:hypothetical protein